MTLPDKAYRLIPRRWSLLLFLIIAIHLCACRSEDQVRAALTAQENEFRDYNESSLAVAPEYWKLSIREDLSDETISERQSPFAMLDQCPLLKRSLYLVFAIIICWLIFSVVMAIDSMDSGEFFSVGCGSTLGFLAASIVIVTLLRLIFYVAAYIVTGSHYYLPWPFAFFLYFLVLFLAVCVALFIPLRELINYGGIRRAIGWVGLVIEFFGFVFTIRDIVRLFL